MGFVHGKNSVFSINAVDISAFTDQVDGLPGAADLSDVTTYGSAGTKSIPGLENCKFSVQGSYDTTASTGLHATLAAVRSSASAVAFAYGPEGSTAGKVKFSGNCWLADWKITGKVSDKVSWQADLQVDGAVSLGTY